MDFKDVLNSYIDQLGCSAKELSMASGVSPAVISRYRSGERIPAADSPQLAALAKGIEELSQQVGKVDLSQDDIMQAFAGAITGIAIDYEAFLRNLNTLVSNLGISNNELARALSFDPSYISRILAGHRHPADMPQFVSVISRYLARRYSNGVHAASVAALVGCEEDAVRDESRCARIIASWLGSNIEPQADSLTEFLRKLDAFNLNEFIRAIKFNEEGGMTMPAPMPMMRVYSGIDEMVEAELDFLKAVTLSQSTEDVFSYSDMPLSAMAATGDFAKRWMHGMALMMKKGLRLIMVHDVNRPFHEMMLGLEGWIPLYMTGQVAPHYLNNPQNDVFCHLLKVSGTAALAGEAIAGRQEEGRYVLTRNRDDVAYYQRRAQALLKRAHPLMEIYRSDRHEEFEVFAEEVVRIDVSRNFLLSTPPICTASPELLDRILERNGVEDADIERIYALVDRQREMLIAALEHGPLLLQVPEVSREEMENHSLLLALHWMYYEGDIAYNYEEYCEHVKQTEEFIADYPQAALKVNPNMAFRNIEIDIHSGECVVLSKNKAPAIHFVIRHPNMLAAFENFAPPLVDGESAEPVD